MFIDSMKYLFRRYILGQRDIYARVGDEIVEMSKNGGQRRAFLRAGCITPVSLQGGELDDRGVVISVSGSGVLILSSNPLEMNAVYTITGVFFDREITMKICINREDTALAGMPDLCGYGAQITSIQEENRKHIIDSVFRQNRWLKELLP